MPVLDFRGKEEIDSHHLGTAFCPLIVDKKKSLFLPSRRGGQALPKRQNLLEGGPLPSPMPI